jgi:hypothetical protein
MTFTAYGRHLARDEDPPALKGTGVTAHLEAIGHDSGIELLLTGHDRGGRPMRLRARSVLGAFALARAAGGIERAWHLLPGGSRKLVLRR